MTMTDRSNPTRANSSDSSYSIMEFMKDFPDDATCLEWLWRTRYSEDGIHANCPRCDCQRVFRRYETKQQRQSWTCIAFGLPIHPTAGASLHKDATSSPALVYSM